MYAGAPYPCSCQCEGTGSRSQPASSNAGSEKSAGTSARWESRNAQSPSSDSDRASERRKARGELIARYPLTPPAPSPLCQ